MAHLLLHGTRCRLITPRGRIIDPYTCRRNTTFTNDQSRLLGYNWQFARDGFRLIVAHGSAIPIELCCADCGKTLALPSLCPTCLRLRGGR